MANLSSSIDLKAIPNLPGYTISPKKQTHLKSHVWGFHGKQRLEFVEGLTHDKPKFVTVPRGPERWRDGETLPTSTTRAFTSAVKQSDTELLPTWGALEKQVLRFSGYCKEQVDESSTENYRARKVTIYYYLEDDTMQVNEPRTTNSGMPQGTLVRRHRLAREEEGSGYISPEDLRIGGSVPIYGRVLSLTDCDNFTREWYRAQGDPQPEGLPIPSDKATVLRQQLEAVRPRMPTSYEKRYREVMLGGGHINEGMQQRMEWDRKVCSFLAVHDDLSTMQFERRHFNILYFLCDDTVEILEKIAPCSGRDNFPKFFKRQRLPRGEITVRGPTDAILKDEDYLHVSEFRVGIEMSFLGLKFYIYDADGHTRRYFQSELGVDLGPAEDVSLQPEERPPAATPPPTGFGSPEDSLGSVKNLVPKVPKKDFAKLMENSYKVLHYECVPANPRPEDHDRTFLISFFLADDTLQVHEPPRRNSGFVGGSFLARGKYTNPEGGKPFVPQDFVVGGRVCIGGFSFNVVRMDEYTERYLSSAQGGEEKRIPAGKLDMEAVLAKLRQAIGLQFHLVRDTFRRFDKDRNGVLTLAEFRSMLYKFGFQLSSDETYSVMRYFDTRNRGQVTYNEFCDALLEADYCDKMLCSTSVAATLVQPDESYQQKIQEREDELKEADAMRRAVRSIQGVFYQRNRLLSRLSKEFYHITTQKTVTCDQIRKAISNIGFEFSLEDVERCVAYVLPDAPLDEVDYLEFVRGLSVTYYDMPAER